MTPEVKHGILEDTAGGMTYLYHMGVEHRDLKCANCLVTHDWRVKVRSTCFWSKCRLFDGKERGGERSRYVRGKETKEARLSVKSMKERGSISKLDDRSPLGV